MTDKTGHNTNGVVPIAEKLPGDPFFTELLTDEKAPEIAEPLPEPKREASKLEPRKKQWSVRTTTKLKVVDGTNEFSVLASLERDTNGNVTITNYYNDVKTEQLAALAWVIITHLVHRGLVNDLDTLDPMVSMCDQLEYLFTPPY